MTSYTVQKLAQMSGVTIRTLRFYDEIGLLKPAFIGENGYRYYQEEQLLILQQILFFRELGFELKQIQHILKQSDFDRVEALKSHKKVLRKNVARMQELMSTIDKTINHLQGKETMKEQELYWGFDHSKEKQKEYEDYLIAKIGPKRFHDQSSKSKEALKHWKKEDFDKAKQEGDLIHKELVKAIEKGLKADSQPVQTIIERHFALIMMLWGAKGNPDEIKRYGELGQLYLEHPDFKKMLDAHHPKLAQFLADAMKVYADKNLA